MSGEESMNKPETARQINHDGRVFGKDGQPDVFIPGHLVPKLGFLIFSVAILLVGFWDLWAPLSRVLFGEMSEGRVVRIVRQSPGQPEEVICVRREIREGDYGYETVFRHFVEVIDGDSRVQVFELGVASRQTPYALVNERVRVAYFIDHDIAYGVFLVRMVGRRIPIDPEDPAELEKERLAQE